MSEKHTSKSVPVPAGFWQYKTAEIDVKDYPDAAVEHPDGRILIRMFDQWFFLDECVKLWP